MSTILWLLAGLGAGTLSLIPGLHLGAIWILAVPFLTHAASPLDAAVAIAAASGLGFCGHALAVVFHPVTGDNLAAADPAQRLAAEGKGLHAFDMLSRCLWYGAAPVFFLALMFLIGTLMHLNLAKTIEPFVQWAGLPIIAFWYASTLKNSKRKLAAVLATLLIGAFGFVATKLPAAQDNGHMLTAILAGIFALPILLATLNHKGHTRSLPTDQSLPGKDARDDLWITGPLVGIAAGFLPGMGSGSLVSLLQGHTQTDEDYLALAGTAEAANGLWALVLALVAGATRSSDAVAIRAVLPQADPLAILILMVTLATALAVGIPLCRKLAPLYAQVVTQTPMRSQALVLITVVIGTVWWQTGLLGLAVAAVGTMCALYARSNYLPNQISFAVLLGPLVLYQLGLAGPLTHAMFGG